MKLLITTTLLSFSLLSASEIYATYSVQAAKEANLAFNIGGIVKKALVDIGDEVKSNELLAELKNSDIKANLNLAQIELKYAKKDYNRQLKVKSVIGQSVLDKFAFKKEIAQAKIAQIKTTLDKTYLKAPFDGVISYKNIEKGDVVAGVNPKVVYKIISSHKRELIVEFDAKYLTTIKVGDTFKYKIDGSNKELKGKIIKIYPTVDAKTQKAKAKVIANDIKVGLFGSGTIITKD
jgi:RND family efflux transporter MFP subunit